MQKYAWEQLIHGKSLQKVCTKSVFHEKSLQKVCKKFPRRRLSRLVQTFEKVCTSLPPDEVIHNLLSAVSGTFVRVTARGAASQFSAIHFVLHVPAGAVPAETRTRMRRQGYIKDSDLTRRPGLAR